MALPLLSGCAQHTAPTAATPPDGGEDANDIGMLAYRQYTVRLLANNRYTVLDAQGTMLAEDIDDWELSERFPFLYQRIVEGTADRPPPPNRSAGAD